jgi:hypothetical protein
MGGRDQSVMRTPKAAASAQRWEPVLLPTITKVHFAMEPEGAKNAGRKPQIRLKPASVPEHF